MMNEVKVLSPIEELKNEFMERYGVKIDVSISVYDHLRGNEHVTKELAEHILRDYSKMYNHYQSDDKETHWCNNTDDLQRPFSLSVFYPGVEDNES